MTNAANQQSATPLKAILNELQDSLLAFCQRLIQTPSVNGVHPEIAVAEIIQVEAQALDLPVELVSVSNLPNRPNVIVSTASEGEIGLLLLGHLDTVPPGDDRDWQYPPFGGIRAGGRIHGRGAVDTKGGMAAAIYALAALKRSGLLAHTRAQFIGVPDEETGATGTLGIKVLAERGLLSGKGAVYAYSGDEIHLGHRGLLRYHITCIGESAHTGSSEWQEGDKGINAVTAMARLLLALEAIDSQLPYSQTPYFEPYRTVITPGTTIQGGASINIVPDRCTATLDIRLTPEYQRTILEPLLFAASQQIEQQTGARFEWTLLNEVPAAISDANARIFEVLETAVPQVTGRPARRAVAGPANEGYLLIEQGIPTVCGLGPAGAGAHGINEYVEVQGLYDAALIFALTALGLDT